MEVACVVNIPFDCDDHVVMILSQLRKGDTFVTTGAMRTVEFKVMDIATATEEEAEYCYVNEDTEILYEGESLKVRRRALHWDSTACRLQMNHCILQPRLHSWWKSVELMCDGQSADQSSPSQKIHEHDVSEVELFIER